MASNKDCEVSVEEKVKPYVCLRKDCGKRFQSQSGRSKHHKTCEKKPEEKEKGYILEDGTGKVRCKECNKPFSEVANWHRHNRNDHKNDQKKGKEKKVYKCMVCSKVFEKNSKLQRHVAIHTRTDYCCETCGRSFKCVDHFDSHVARCEANENATQINDDEYCMVYDEMDVDVGDKYIDFLRENGEKSSEGRTDEVDIFMVNCAVDEEIDHTDAVTVQAAAAADDDDAYESEIGDDIESENEVEIEVPKTTRRRKSANLSNVLQKIVEMNLNPIDQAKILRSSLVRTVNRTVLDTLMLPVENENIYEAKLVSGVLDYLKGLNLKRATDKKHFRDLLHHCCDEESLDDEEFLRWLARRINKRPHRILSIMNSFDESETRGRKMRSLETRQAVFDAWHGYSIVTVDRRDGRDQVTMKEIEYVSRFSKLQVPEDVELEYFKSNRNQRKVRSTRRIATKTVREMKKKLADSNHDVSIGFIIGLKPFYVQNPSEREKESCLCKFCLNLRLRFSELNRHIKDTEKIVHSMSQYFAHGITCNVGENGFVKLKCITSGCEKCHLQPMLNDNDFNIPMTDIKFHQFLEQKYTYTSKKGELKEGKRTIRTECFEPFSEFKKHFNSKAQVYLMHRFEIKNDLHHWPQILEDSDLGYIFHQDYSENVSCSPKFEPQDAHFSSKQTSLHCTVVHSSEEKANYAYHISDNKVKDSAYTSLVTRDLLKHFDEYDKYPLVRIKTDNCSTQYCCLHVFSAYSNLSEEIGKPIILHYGVNGHGRGLVDAMSGFGCKSPLRRAIITDNFFFHSDEELVMFLKRIFDDDNKTYYTVISSEVINEERKNRDEGLPIAGCQKSRMIAFFPDGTWQKKRHLCSCRYCKWGKFDKCVNELDVVNEVSNDELDLLDETEGIDPQMYAFVEEESYVALYSSSKSLELFYLLKVIEKAVATEDITDIYGHPIQKGSQYISGYYLEKINEKKGKMYYKQLQKVVYVYPSEIFCPAVPIDKTGLFLPAQEYQFLADSI